MQNPLSKIPIRKTVLLPPFILVMLAVLISLFEQERFLSLMTLSNNWIIRTFGWLFSTTAFMMVVICSLIPLTPLNKIRLGGKHAKPRLKRWQWFSIVLCTTIATGILFWGTAEPLYHLRASMEVVGAESQSQEAKLFAMSSLFLHWSFTPYAIYTLVALMFALSYHNQQQPFSLSSILGLPISEHKGVMLNSIIDAICLFSLVAGMSASLGAGALTLSGGLGYFLGINSTGWIIGGIILLIVICFSLSAISGLLKGIRILSGINFWIFLMIAFFVLYFGPTMEILSLLGTGLMEYGSTFVSKSFLALSARELDWPKEWTVFNWANWMAWAPVTALFLGKIARGYTVREFLIINWIIPSIFSIIWMAIFGGSSIALETSGALALSNSLEENGPESIIYLILETLPWSPFVISIFLLAVFLSYVTAADSNTEAMSNLSTKHGHESPKAIKLIWGGSIGLMAWVMVSYAGIDGVKMLSNLGGLPILFLLTLVCFRVIRLIFQKKRKTTESFCADSRHDK